MRYTQQPVPFSPESCLRDSTWEDGESDGNPFAAVGNHLFQPEVRR